MSESVGQPSVESLAAAVTEVVSDVESCEPLELPPLYDAVDVDALRSFCAHVPSSDGESVEEGVVWFTYSDSIVHVDTSDPVTVSATEATDETGFEAFPDPDTADDFESVPSTDQ